MEKREMMHALFMIRLPTDGNDALFKIHLLCAQTSANEMNKQTKIFLKLLPGAVKGSYL